MASWLDCRVSVEPGKCWFDRSCRTSWSRGEVDNPSLFFANRSFTWLTQYRSSILNLGWLFSFSSGSTNKVSSITKSDFPSSLGTISSRSTLQWCMGNTILQRSHQPSYNSKVDHLRDCYNFWNFITRIRKSTICARTMR